jgi:GAF domain-containing protein
MISSSLELSDVLSEVMDTVIALTGAERAYLVLCDPGTGALETAVARNWDRETLSETDVVFSRSIINRAIAEGVPVITTNATSDDRFLNVQSVVSHGLRAILCIPLMMRGRAMGVLYADNRLSHDVFLNDSIALLTAFGTQAAIAIENARQYGRVRDDLSRVLDALDGLRIEIDRTRLEHDVSQITESEYFQRLSESARNMRGRTMRMPPDESAD